MKRLWELDALRGLMLVLMTLTHMPSRLTAPTNQPFGYVSAAEGFVLLSAFMAGLVYGRRGLRDGAPAMRTALLGRSVKVYLCHLALLVFAFTLIAFLALYTGQEAAIGLLSYYLEAPMTAWLAALLLFYTPPLLDILPLYVLFLLLSPLLLGWGRRRGWGVVFGVSIGFWFAAQFGFGVWLYGHLAESLGWSMTVGNTGAFSLWAWQLLWIIGLWLGVSMAQQRREVLHMPRWAGPLAVALAVLFLAWRHGIGPNPFGDELVLNLWFDKWTLGPLRMLNLFALMVVAIVYGPALVARLRPPGFLVRLGQASLPVFCAHLVVVLLALAVVGDQIYDWNWMADLSLLLLCFAVLYVVAWWEGARKRRIAAGRPSGGAPASSGLALPSKVGLGVTPVAMASALPVPGMAQTHICDGNQVASAGKYHNSASASTIRQK